VHGRLCTLRTARARARTRAVCDALTVTLPVRVRRPRRTYLAC